MLLASDADYAEQKAVVEHRQDSEKAKDNAACECDEADGDVVGHDCAGSLRLHAHNRLGPHFVVLDGINHPRAEHVPHELRPRQSEHGAERPAREQDDEREEDVAESSLNKGRVIVAHKVEDFQEPFAPAGIDDMVGPSQQLVNQLSVSTSGGVLTQSREVAGYLPVQQGGFSQFVARKAAHSVLRGLTDEPVEAVPVRAALGEPLIGENDSHGIDWRPA